MEFPCRAFLCACGGRYAPPPHAWGIRAGLLLSLPARRFIPTCVGNAGARNARQAHRPVHPHVRGEYRNPPLRTTSMSGSSPHAWGILAQRDHDLDAARFIPTCVGNTDKRREEHHAKTVHPHVRGEYASMRSCCIWMTGSSPRAWGIQHGAVAVQGQLRFIPTCVGNTPRCPTP